MSRVAFSQEKENLVEISREGGQLTTCMHGSILESSPSVKSAMQIMQLCPSSVSLAASAGVNLVSWFGFVA